MSPKTYGFLWTLVIVAAGIIWLAGVFTLITAVVFGFIAFGMTFMGMMCVLPGVVAHPGLPRVEKPTASTNRLQTERKLVPRSQVRYPVSARFY